MTIIGSDRSGPRVQCATYRESRSCTNGARYYVEKIERMVLDALRIQLKDPNLIEEYVKEYRAERARLQAKAHRERSDWERKLAAAKKKITGVVASIAEGTISSEEARAILEPARVERDQAQRELDNAKPSDNVVELHPQAVSRFKENVEELSAILAQKDEPLDILLTDTFRSLVDGVVVKPRQAGEEYQVQIRGYLASLMGFDESATVMVAEEGLEPPTRGL